MGSENLPLRNIDIYHNLPTFDSSLTNLTAIVTGANGISGFYLMRALLDSPERWSKIYALSRRPPPEGMMALLSPEQRAKVQHVACDFLTSPEEIASALKSANVQASHIFFYSYLQPKPPAGAPLWSNKEELVKVNTALLSNFLNALPQANITPKRFLLQTGAKNYGVHIGRARQPAQESDPQPSHLEPNFYYPQEAALFEYCKTNPSVKWNVVMPAWIIGAVNNAAMNALHPFAIYAAVQARKNQPLSFTGDWTAWQQVCNHSTARLTGYLTEWIVLETKTANQRFNSTDTSPFTMERFYENLVRWYGVTKGIDTPSGDSSAYMEIKGASGKDTPLGHGPPLVFHASFSLVQWAQDKSNRDVWEDMMRESGGKLTHNPFENPEDHFSCGDAASLPMILSMNKARKLGWTGYVDTMESVFEMYRDMVTLGMLPGLKVGEAGV